MADRPLPAYDGDEAFVFVSYSHQDEELVYPEIRWLQDQGINVWYDEGIGGAARWRDAIAGRLTGCHLLLFYLSPTSVSSQVCREELEFALDAGRPVLSVYLQPTSLPDGIRLAITNRQALLRHELDSDDYERKLLSAVTINLEQPLPATKSSLHRSSRTSTQRTSWTIAAVCSLVVGGVIGLSVWFSMRPEPPAPRLISRFELLPPAGVILSNVSSNSFAISADGRRVVFSGLADDVNQLYLRNLDDLEASPIRGTAGGPTSLFISPDGESVVYYDSANDALKKIRVTGGSPETIVRQAGGIQGLSWGQDGTIVFSGDAYPYLLRVSDSGGTPEQLTFPEEGEHHGHPHLLADGSAVLFDVSTNDNLAFDHIAVRSLVTGEERKLIEGAFPHVTGSGHLLFARGESVWALEFDAHRLEVKGADSPVLSDVWITRGMGLSVAADGSMVYLPATTTPTASLVWVNPEDGSEVVVPASPDLYIQPRISPDGRHVLVRRGADDFLWVYSLERETFIRLTDVVTFGLVWSPDAKKIVYTPMEGKGTANLHWRNADGTGDEERLTTSARYQYPATWSRDGHEILYNECSVMGLQSCDLGRVNLTGVPRAELFLATEFNELNPALSPDGQWIAYESDREGQHEIYVQPYAAIDSGRWKISIDGGRHPIWSPDGSTLYYSAGSTMSRQMMSVDIETDSGFIAGDPQLVFEFTHAWWLPLQNHDLHPDGGRFLLVKPTEPSRTARPIVYVQNWLEEVERLVPTSH
jgi:serine/threonine-protein kinase